jgi:drug/metabolite transporter (DMT)-like permease
LLGAVVILPVTFASGQFIPPHELLSRPGYALILSSVAHALVYAGYVWLVGRAGPVFTVQVSYLVTGFGLLWARLILDEAYPPAVWAALALIFLGMYLVQPKRKRSLAPT